ncbi:terminase large subunit domain-containing protein [Morganella morganii]
MTIKIEVTADLIINLYDRLSLFPAWQKRWYQQRFQKYRCLHKGRQIGASGYFSYEALLDACLTGTNKVFIAVEPSDNEVFRCAEMDYMLRYAGVTDTAEDSEMIIELSNGAKIYFIPAGARIPCFQADYYLSEWAFFENPVAVMQSINIAGATSGIIMYGGVDTDGHQRDELIKALRRSRGDMWKTVFLYSPKNASNDISVVPLTKTALKGRITLYSSRVEGDNGGLVDDEMLTNGYYDVVPRTDYEMGEVFNSAHCLKEWAREYDDKVFRELYLCQRVG